MSDLEVVNEQEMKAHFIKCFPEEGCGLLVDNKFLPKENIAEEKTLDFKIDGREYLKHKVQAVIHSHTCTTCHQLDMRTPSMADMMGQKSTAVPWGIVGTEGENVTPILWFGKEIPDPIEGRTYIPGVYDCLTLVCDYMKLEFNIDCPTFPRPPVWDAYNKNMIEENYENAGFVRIYNVGIDDLVKGDAILFKILGSTIDHCGVYTGDGKFYHQQFGRLSQEAPLQRWQNKIAMFVRHKELM